VAAPSRLRTGLRSVARLVTPSPREPEQPPVRPPAEAEPVEAWSPAEAGPEPEPAADVLPLPTGELGTATFPETALEPPAVSQPQPVSEPDREPEPELASEPERERKPEPASALKAPEPRSGSDLLEPIWNVLDLLEQEPPAGSGPTVGPWRPAPRALGRRFPARPGLRLATVAWIVTAGALVAATLAVIQTNPPQPPAAVKRVAAPPYSYYAPVQAQPGAPQPRP